MGYQSLPYHIAWQHSNAFRWKRYVNTGSFHCQLMMRKKSTNVVVWSLLFWILLNTTGGLGNCVWKQQLSYIEGRGIHNEQPQSRACCLKIRQLPLLLYVILPPFWTNGTENNDDNTLDVATEKLLRIKRPLLTLLLSWLFSLPFRWVNYSEKPLNYHCRQLSRTTIFMIRRRSEKYVQGLKRLN